MAEEKRVQLGVDIGQLSNQLVQINNLVAQNYQKALQGQAAYNKILERSIELLQQQVDFVEQLGSQNQLMNFSAPVSSIPIGGGEDDKSSKQNDIVEEILENVKNIWDKFSSLGNPLPVKVVNTPLTVRIEGEEGSKESSVSSGGDNNAIQGGNGRGENRNGSGSNVVGRSTNIIAAGASDPNYIIAGIAGMIPIIGAGLASILNKMIGEAEQRVRAGAIFRGATGGNMPFISLQGLGYKNAEVYQKEAQYYPANIRLSLEDFQFEKGYGVSSGAMESLLRSMRQENLQLPSSILGVNYLEGLKSRGLIDEKEVRAYTEDYLKILVELNQKQLETTGETNSLISSEVVQGIAKTSDKFGDPTVLANVVQSIQGGLTQAPSAQAEALQYYALSQANPNANIWQMQLMRENPFGEESRGYLSNYLQALMQTGSDVDVRFNVMSALGLTAHQTEALLSGINRAKIKSEDFYSRIQRGEELSEKEQKEYGELEKFLVNGSFDLTQYLEGRPWNKLIEESTIENFGAKEKIKEEAGKATAENEVLLAQASDRLADVGEPILKFINKSIESSGQAVKLLEQFFTKGLSGTLKEWWQDVKIDIQGMIPPPFPGLLPGQDPRKYALAREVAKDMKKNQLNPNSLDDIKKYWDMKIHTE